MTPPRRGPVGQGKVAPPGQRNGYRNKLLRAEVLRLYGPVCHLCGARIDLALKYPHPWSYEVDHLLTVKDHPERLYDASICRPAHRRHNGQRGDRSVAYAREAIKREPRRVEAARKAPPKRRGARPRQARNRPQGPSTDLTW